MTNILCIETSQDICSVALGKGNDMVDYLIADEIRSHGKNLTPLIDEIFKRNQISVSQLDCIALSIGPGSYTGLRIGTSVAKGLAYVYDIPIVTLNSLEIMANEAKTFHQADYEYYYPMIDARRMEVYCASFDQNLVNLRSSEALILTDIELANHFDFERGFFFGSGSKKLEAVISNDLKINFNHHISATARAMIGPAIAKFNNRDFVDTAYFEPFYLKPFYTNAKKSQ